jgi:CRISPR-associated protein Cmr3
MTMTTIHHRFIEPLDVLFLRGNKLFGDAGSYGASLVPPWPSVAAGALRSAMLANEGIDLAAFAQGRITHPTLGTPKVPGAFTITAFSLARRLPDGGVESLHALPADLTAEEDEAAKAQGSSARRYKLRRLKPVVPVAGLISSAPLAQWPVLAQPERSKPAGGCWLTQAGWSAYLAGRVPMSDQLLTTGQLWQLDERVGVGLDMAKRRAADGQLFTVQAVALHAGIGFLASVAEAEPPADGVLRFGGDGRGAALRSVHHQPAMPNLAAIAQARRARVVLTTPGLFAEGWRLPGVDADQRITWPGFSARLVCAAVAKSDVISGWDLAARQPKPAERVAPAGSVYWLDDIDTTAAALGKLAEHGLWFADANNAQRRAEGFNRFTFAAW